MLVASPLDLQQNELRQARVHNLPAPGPAVGTSVKGQLWFNSTANELFYFDGTAWQSAKSGAGSSGPPSGPAGGSLSGTYPNPAIAPLAVTDAMVATANKDGANGTPSMRTLGLTAGKAIAGDEYWQNMKAPIAPVNMGTQRLSNVMDPATSDQAANKNYVDTKVAAVVVPDATTGVKGIVQLAGDLAGTAASPQIAAGVITDADVNAANKDGAVGTASMRTLGLGAAQAMPGNTRLDQVTAPTTNVSMNFSRIYNLGDPGSAYDAATKNYVDGVAQGLDAKQSVRFASTANLGLSGTASLPDGLAVNVGDRVLAKDQGTPSLNGIYVVASGTWTRATDADAWAELPGAFVFVEEGNTQKDTGWVCTVDAGGTLGTTAVTWTQFSGAGQITDGIGLLKTGNTLDVRLDGTTIEAPADILQVKDGGITNAKLGGAAITVAKGGTGAGTAFNARSNLGVLGVYSTATHGAGTTISIPNATHQLNVGKAFIVQCRLEATGEEIMVDNTVDASGNVTITFATSQAANTVRVILLG